MPRLFKVVIVGFLLGIQLISVARYNPYPHGMGHDVRYRNKERLIALIMYTHNTSPSTKAIYEEELRLMHKHEDWKKYVALGLMAILNGIGIFYFLREPNRGVRLDSVDG